MAVKIYFETLAPGMNAKLDARYRTSKDKVHAGYTSSILRQSYRNDTRTGFLEDPVGKCRPKLAVRSV